MIKVGILALQGAVREHACSFKACDVEVIEVKTAAHLAVVDGLVLPGGESTTMRRLIKVCDLTQPLIEFKESKKPIFGTCAGLILLAKTVENEQSSPLGNMDITVARNSFGRQVDSFETKLNIKHIGNDFPAVFIRAPHIACANKHVEILAEYNDRIVMAKQENMLGCSFHPELTADNRVSQFFIDMIKEHKSSLKQNKPAMAA